VQVNNLSRNGYFASQQEALVAFLNQAQSKGQTGLMAACLGGHTDLVEFLLAQVSMGTNVFTLDS
jgi:ankyrin repeat protein